MLINDEFIHSAWHLCYTAEGNYLYEDLDSSCGCSTGTLESKNVFRGKISIQSTVNYFFKQLLYYWEKCDWPVIFKLLAITLFEYWGNLA